MMAYNVCLITLLTTYLTAILAEEGLVSNQNSFHRNGELITKSPIDGEHADDIRHTANNFMSMRNLNEKRSNFMPLRGKKEFTDWDASKRAQGFMPMRGRRDYGDYYSGDTYNGNYPSADYYDQSVKRMSGFMPMRGKKYSDEDEKRAGFHALRGKKDDSDLVINDALRNAYESQQNLDKLWTDQLSNEKRAKSAFFGMRGKRAVQHS